jgi:phytoene dehydrogenase-like protein
MSSRQKHVVVVGAGPGGLTCAMILAGRGFKVSVFEGGTHPGSGLPTIYESGRISANLISRKHNMVFVSGNLET